MMKADSIAQPHPAGDTRKPGKLDEKSKAKLSKAVKEFQSLFVGYLLKAMRSTIPKAEGGEGGFGGDIMEGMFDMELARHVSNNGSFGIGEMLYKQMTGEDLPTSPVPRPDPAVSIHRQNPTVEFGKSIAPASSRSPQLLRPESQPVMPGTNAPSTKDSSRMSLPKILNNSQAPTVRTDTLSRRIGRYDDVIKQAGEVHSLDVNLLKAVIASESGGHANAQSGKDAKGLMQLVDSTAADMGVKNVWDPRDNIMGGAKYLKQLLDKFDGDIKLALASYNAGPATVEKHKGIPPYKETQDYIKKVLDYVNVFEQKESKQ